MPPQGLSKRNGSTVVKQLKYNRAIDAMNLARRLLVPLCATTLMLQHRTLALPQTNQCPNGMMSLYHSAACTNDLTCQSLATGFFCLRQQCCAHVVPPVSGYGTSCNWDADCRLPNAECRHNVCYCRVGYNYNSAECIPRAFLPCALDMIRINDACYPLVGAGERCLYDLQCRSAGIRDRALYCANYICQYYADARDWKLYPFEREFPVCRNPSAEVELSGGMPKDCIYQRCSPGFHCEYNRLYKGGQYICCGASLTNPIYGQPKMYPGYTNLPLECHGVNSCTFVDYPYCVYSESYRHNLWCSKPQCL